MPTTGSGQKSCRINVLHYTDNKTSNKFYVVMHFSDGISQRTVTGYGKAMPADVDGIWSSCSHSEGEKKLRDKLSKGYRTSVDLGVSPNTILSFRALNAITWHCQSNLPGGTLISSGNALVWDMSASQPSRRGPKRAPKRSNSSGGDRINIWL